MSAKMKLTEREARQAVVDQLTKANAELARLRERIVKLEACVKAADALRFIPSYEYNLGVERFDSARAALGEVK